MQGETVRKRYLSDDTDDNKLAIILVQLALSMLLFFVAAALFNWAYVVAVGTPFWDSFGKTALVTSLASAGYNTLKLSTKIGSAK